LILHGLTEQQVDAIQTTRRLIPSVTIQAPEPASCHSVGKHEELLQVAELAVTPGEHVAAGTRLCTLADYCELYIEGGAFEQDAPKLTEAANRGTPITAIIERNGKGTQTVSDLPILYVENEVKRDSRKLLFYVPLPNELVRNETRANGHRFIGWRYKPGQRVQLHVPVETWENRIVLPVDAVVKEGVDWFVFQQNGDHFDRRAVHVEYRDQRWAVIENDGTLFPGDVVAASGAYQMHLAMKNKAGSGVDPHAGHNH
jgi:multidrug efflux pump subunit AcrA (membrane-fusion protein)